MRIRMSLPIKLHEIICHLPAFHTHVLFLDKDSLESSAETKICSCENVFGNSWDRNGARAILLGHSSIQTNGLPNFLSHSRGQWGSSHT